MFKMEQDEYEREQIQWDRKDFGLDLEPCIQLISSQVCVVMVVVVVL